MILQFTFPIILLITLPGFSLAYNLSPNWILAQPGCDSRCGDVSIPYPFGMKDPNCYVDKWFEIECRNSTPYLKSLNFEVTFIDFHIMWIMSPVFYWNCDGKNKPEIIDLKGSPFMYSQDSNTFSAYGCNKLAILESDGSRIGGCVSLCDDNDKSFYGGNGCHHNMPCCDTSLPMHLSEYNITFLDLNNKSINHECSYAYIQTYQYGEFQHGNQIINGHVMTELEWEILNEVMSNNSNKLDHSSDSYCNKTSVTSSSQNKTSGWKCYCNDGYGGDPYIDGSCYSPYEKSHSHSKKWAIVGVSSSLGSVILIFGLWWSYRALRKRMIKKRKEKFFKRNGGLLLQQRLSSTEVSVHKILFTLKDIERATDKFNVNRILGKGGQGTVYKGMLVDGKIVAVKKFKVQGKVEEFINEFVVLSQINHRNVVKLLGCCLETDIPLLVYEFIPNGNLYEYLHAQNEELPVTWDIRLRMATEIAGALFYLHSIASQPIYHRDIKSTNILLDEK